ncbi:Swt1 family HEPN domain-containing protein [Rhodopseudomonas palustris]|uniref:Swt1 family HEPN domain-containing protein n=1 Tax=Rhodopseudomonas palustris TaxID=1076 RepID=UPI0020CD19C6|nr:Swt1 family HEPN domain-containing protein [Rhodopseudomonas palustris]MCP9630286.1 Swt1 family HEPN domain-containing protein [Rhodopseudomonas palustris]
MDPDDKMKLAEAAANDALRLVAEPLAKLQLSMDVPTSLPLTEISKTCMLASLGLETSRLRDLAIGALSVKGNLARLAGLPKIDSLSLSALTDQNRLKLLSNSLSNLGTLHPGYGAFRGKSDAAFGAYHGLQDRFRLPELGELAKLTKGAFSPSDAWTDSSLFSAMRSMHTPWLLRENTPKSIHAFTELQAIGRALRNAAPFDQHLTNSLRNQLGDWRGLTSLPTSIFDNSKARSDFYVARGFDPSLTDFSPKAFDESTALAGLNDDAINEEEIGVARTNRAHEQLLRFERKLREFINRVMTAEFGDEWVRTQTPAGMLDDWHKKKRQAEERGARIEPLISYADFSDYIKIVERTDNWKLLFKTIFCRRESVQESFFRLFPIRICTMHARLITLDDELLLRVEIRRLSQAIDNWS